MSSRGKRSGRGMKSTPPPRTGGPTAKAAARASTAASARRPSPSNAGSLGWRSFLDSRNYQRKGPVLWFAIVGVAAIVVAVLAVTVLRPGTSAKPTTPARSFSVVIGPPSATPLASPPAEPASSGVVATIHTSLGDIVIQIFDQSAPVAATNFTNLASVGFYDGLTFHRVVPGFVIQGGDPNGDGSGGPGYTIQDEPVVGEYARGIVAMARTAAPDSQGSQFFIVLDDSAKQALDAARNYVIFGKVTAGMDVADKIGAMPNSGSASGNQALDPVVMTSVTVGSQ